MSEHQTKTIQGLQLLSKSMIAFVLLVLLWILTYAAAWTAWLGPESAKSMAFLVMPASMIQGLVGGAYLILALFGKIKCRTPEAPGKTELLLSVTFDIIACLLYLSFMGPLAQLPALVSLLLFLAYLFRLGEANKFEWLQNQSKVIGSLLLVAYGAGVFLPLFGPAVATLVAVGSAVFLIGVLKRTIVLLEE